MKTKKSPKADLQNKRTLFLEIGLIIAIAISISVFVYNSQDKVVEIMALNANTVTEELPPITIPEDKPALAQKIVLSPIDVIRIVENDAKITETLDFPKEDIESIPNLPQLGKTERPTTDDEPFIIVENMPRFKDGDIETFRKWVISKLVYPAVASDNGVGGRVVLSFVIERDGSLSDVSILANPDKSLTDEAVRVLKSSPKWTPGKQRATPVRVKYTIPVDFRLEN